MKNLRITMIMVSASCGLFLLANTPAYLKTNMKNTATVTQETQPCSSAYDSLTRQAAARYGVSAEILCRIINIENGPKLPSFVQPSTAASLGVRNNHDPAEVIPAMAKLLADYQRMFGSEELAVAAFNAGPSAVQKYHGIPPFRETRRYVARVMVRAPESSEQNSHLNQPEALCKFFPPGGSEVQSKMYGAEPECDARFPGRSQRISAEIDQFYAAGKREELAKAQCPTDATSSKCRKLALGEAGYVWTYSDGSVRVFFVRASYRADLHSADSEDASAMVTLAGRIDANILDTAGPATTKPRASSAFATAGGMHGDVSISRNGGDPVDMTAGTELHEGDEISTGPDSEVTVTFADGSTILVQPMTQISMASLATQRNSVKARMNLIFGKVAAKVNKEKTEASDYSVKTPTATASVRGTKFTVQFDKQTQATTVAVEEGVVQIMPNNPALRAVSLNAGQQVQVAQNRVGQVTSVESAETVDPNVQKLRNILGPILNGTNSSGNGSSANASGRWVGNYTNTKGEAGKSTITINQLADGSITGDEDGWRIENGRWNGNSLTWQYLGQSNGCRDYQVSLQISNDGQALTGSYQVTDRCASPSTYGGRYVSYRRQ